MATKCNCPDNEAKCPTCPSNPRCRYYVPKQGTKWYRCGNPEMWGTCALTAKSCPTCVHYKPPGLRGRPRKDEFFDPGLDDPRAFDPNVSAADLRAATQKRYYENNKDNPDFKAKRAAYMRQYRKRGKGRASEEQP